MNKLNMKKFTKYDIIALVVFAVTSVLLLVRIQYGIGYDDECFYISSALRYIKGDAFITHEWHMAQFSFYHLVGFVKLYLKIFGTTDGILLGSRYFMVVIRCLATILFYLEIRRYNSKFAIGMIAIDMMHIPLTISYNTGYYFFDIVLLEMIAVCYLSALRNYKPYKIFLLGIFIAHAIISNPFFIIYPLILLIVSVVRAIYVKAKDKPLFLENEKLFFGIKAWLLMAAGVIAVVVPLLIFWFRRTTLAEILKAFPALFMDLEYNFSSDAQNVFTPIKTLTETISLDVFAFVIMLGTIVAFIIDKKKFCSDKNKFAFRKLIYLSLELVAFLIYIIKIKVIHNFYEGNMFWMMPMMFFCLAVYIFSEKKNKTVFRCLCLPAFVMAVSLDISSDTGIRASNIAFEVVNIAGVVFIGDLFYEIKEQIDINEKLKKAMCIILASIIPLQVAFQISTIFDFDTSSYEARLSAENEFNTKITKGPLKGVITTPERAELYYNQLSDLDIIKEKNNGQKNAFLSTSNYCYCYLYLSELDVGAYSTWFPGTRWFHDVSPRVYLYNELYPEKNPKYIYASLYDDYVIEDRSAVLKIIKDLEKHYDYEIMEGKAGYILVRK